jgi:hypothetical protein
VDHLVDVPRDPGPLLGREPETADRQVALQHHGARQIRGRHLPPVIQELVDPFGGCRRLRSTNDHGQPTAGGGEVAKERAAEKAGGTGEQNGGVAALHACHTWIAAPPSTTSVCP